MSRAFGIVAMQQRDAVQRIARAVESLGYSALWTNDTPGTDGLQTAAWALEQTSSLTVGVGVCPLDRRPAPSLVSRIDELGLRTPRLILGVGSGFSETPLQTVSDGIDHLRKSLGSDMSLAVAAMGPAMCRRAGSIADVVLLNWMTPPAIAKARLRISRGAQRNTPPTVAAYVRAALDPGAVERLSTEAARYAQIPAYARLFESMRPKSPSGIAGDPRASELNGYEDELDQLVIRGVPAEPVADQWLEIAECFAPPIVAEQPLPE